MFVIGRIGITQSKMGLRIGLTSSSRQGVLWVSGAPSLCMRLVTFAYIMSVIMKSKLFQSARNHKQC